MLETALIVVAIFVNTGAIISVAIRLERRLTKLETNQSWMINHYRKAEARHAQS